MKQLCAYKTENKVLSVPQLIGLIKKKETLKLNLELPVLLKMNYSGFVFTVNPQPPAMRTHLR